MEKAVKTDIEYKEIGDYIPFYDFSVKWDIIT